MKNSFDRIITSAPVDKTASVVVRGKGEHWNPKNKITQRHWNAPPKCRPLPKDTEDRAGLKIGRLTVVRYYRSKPKDGGSLWLVRCTCGAYETRSTGAVENTNNVNDCCHQCRHLNYVRNGYHRDGSRIRQPVRSLEPLPTKAFTPNGTYAEDLTGKVVGSLTVIGNSPGKTGSGGSKWVVRCICGAFEIRNGKYLRRALASGNVSAACDVCDPRRKLGGAA